MRIAVSLVILAAVVWSALWFTAARSALRSAETWFAEQGAAGLEAGYGLLEVTGFPARLMLEIESPRLGDPFAGPPGGLGWASDTARIEAALPRPGTVTLQLPGAQRLALGPTPLTLTGDRLAVALRFGGLPLAPRRAEATGRALQLTAPDWEAVLAAFDASLLPEPEGTAAAEATALRLSLELADLVWIATAPVPRPNAAADTLSEATAPGAGAPGASPADADPTDASPNDASPTGSAGVGGASAPAAATPPPPPATARLETVRLDAVLAFDRPLLEPLPPPDMPLPPPPRLQAVTLEGLSLRVDEARLGAEGRIEIDPEGWPDGRLTLRLEGLEALLGQAVTLGLMAPEVAPGWEQALGRLAPAGTALTLPLVFEAGRMRLGPLPLGAAPRLALPAEPAPFRP